MTERIDPAITEKIVHALATYLKRDPASITENHHLRDDLGLDSVAVIELLFEIEERFKLQIPDQDLPGLSTVGSVAAYVQRQLVALPSNAKSESLKPAPAKTPSRKSVSKKARSSKPTMKKPASPKSSSTKSALIAAKKSKAAATRTSTTKKKGATR
jgi:acyl carrier protein